jgi:hypothetical protein
VFSLALEEPAPRASRCDAWVGLSSLPHAVVHAPERVVESTCLGQVLALSRAYHLPPLKVDLLQLRILKGCIEIPGVERGA